MHLLSTPLDIKLVRHLNLTINEDTWSNRMLWWVKFCFLCSRFISNIELKFVFATNSSTWPKSLLHGCVFVAECICPLDLHQGYHIWKYRKQALEHAGNIVMKVSSLDYVLLNKQDKHGQNNQIVSSGNSLPSHWGLPTEKICSGKSATGYLKMWSTLLEASHLSWFCNWKLASGVLKWSHLTTTTWWGSVGICLLICGMLTDIKRWTESDMLCGRRN